MDLVERYAQAERLLPDTWPRLVHGGVAVPQWIDHGPDFTFIESTPEGKRCLLVDGATGEARPLFDHDKVASQLSDLLGVPFAAGALALPNLRVSGGGASFSLGLDLRVDLDTATLTATELPAIGFDEAPSPDGSRICFRRGFDLWVRDRIDGAERQVTFDGARGFEYAATIDVTKMTILFETFGIPRAPAVVWSQDSSRLATLRIDQRKVEQMHLVRSRPADGGRPQLHSYYYAMVGDEHLPTAELVCIDAAGGGVVVADCGPQMAAYFCGVTAKEVWWAPDDAEVLWVAYQRAARGLTLFAMDPVTGHTRQLHAETSDLPVMPKQDVMAMDQTTIRSLPSGEVLWWSEASGYGHLSVIGADGSQRTLTSGEWIVRDVVAGDQEYVWFTGLGREPGLDPYVRCFYRVALAGGDVEVLVADGLDHAVHGSPDASRFVDVASYLDRPAVSRLLDRDGSQIAVLSEADASALFAAGYVPPERFVVKGADGVTDIWGVLYRPIGFDESQSYPVLDDTYPGPQLASAHIAFPCAGALIPHLYGSSMAALGFAVVSLDGRGTPMRGRDFQMHAWLTGDDEAGLNDRVAGIGELAQRYPWLDLDRVGIYGHSGGGYESARALMLQPEFYKVGVASAGGYDALPYHATWGEVYVGPPGADIYRPHAVEPHVDALVGKLLLIHGELDDNVTPYIMLRLVDALIKADKDFDMLLIPGEEHGMYQTQQHWWRRRWDYFVRHLMGLQPPTYKIAPRPSVLGS